MQSIKPYQRYESLIDDWSAFTEICFRPLPTCIWTNTLRITPERLAGIFATEGIKFEQLTWHPGGFKLAPDFQPGHHWAFLAGLYHVQEEVSMLPAFFLNPQPGERVLDLCAAPGNKAAQMAVHMQNRGTVVANDINYRRMRAARQTFERLGLLNVATTICDGGNFPKNAGLFDKVLVDVPCSCEGTSRKNIITSTNANVGLSLKRSQGQRAILRKAILRCQPGGRIVYATCTYAPEENECVVDAILREFGPEVVRLMPVSLEALTYSSGLTVWNGQQLQPSLQHTMRIWPHQNDTGGFFVALIEKIDPTSANKTNQTTPALSETVGRAPEADELLKILAVRFGLGSDAFGDNIVFRKSKDRVYLATPDHYPPKKPRPDAFGMHFMKTDMKFPKLSTAAAQAFGRHAGRNFIDLDGLQAQAYLNRQRLAVSADQTGSCTGMGYVLLRHQGFVLGVGLFSPNEAGASGTVGNMYPKGWSPNKG